MRSAAWHDEVDLVGLILEAVGQIPRGKVSTFGDIAAALGDVRAARAIGTVLADHAGDAGVPGHRVVFSDGTIAGQGRGGDRYDDSEESLRQEGIGVHGGRVDDIDRTRFRAFDLHPILEELQREQESMRSLIVEEDAVPNFRFVEGLDASYSGERACVAMVRMDLDTFEVVEERTGLGEARFPYVPGYLGYREMPLARLVTGRKEGTVLLIDGHGVLHPRGFGVACHVGVALGLPTIGAAKSLFVGHIESGDKVADVSLDGAVRGRRIGAKGQRATFVSVGHRVSLGTACDLCERLMLKGVPEPLRLAHILATRERKRLEMGT
jgi:deoxyribonuclease V